MLACLPFVWVQASHGVRGLHVLQCCPRIWVIIPPPLTSRVSSLFPFQPFVWTDGIGEAREESHSVLINSPHTQTQTWALGTRGLGKGCSLATAIGTWCSEIQRQPGWGPTSHGNEAANQQDDSYTCFHKYIHKNVCLYDLQQKQIVGAQNKSLYLYYT